MLGAAEDVRAEDVTHDGQLYYVINSPVAHELIKVIYAKNKLYPYFVKALVSPTWNFVSWTNPFVFLLLL